MDYRTRIHAFTYTSDAAKEQSNNHIQTHASGNGLFNPLMKEMVEMMYQYDQDYYIDSTRFKMRFPDFKVTPCREGVKQVVTAG